MWNVQDWYYRGEGNANIVFAHKTDDIVLRLAKCPVSAYDCIFSRATTFTSKQVSSELFTNYGAYSNRDAELSRNDLSKVSANCFYQDDEDNLESEIKKDLEDIKTSLCFARCVMCPLLGSRYVDAGRLVHVPKQFVCHIGEFTKSERPNSRQHKTVVPADQVGVIMPDFCQIAPHSVSSYTPGDHLSTTVCVEIKPKQGFIESKFSATQQSTVCRFCMFQHVKLKKGAISALSSYCPLDLFSGSYKRTKLALTALFASPQNNLRIFANGNEVFGVSSNCDVEKFQSFLKKTLFADPTMPLESGSTLLDRLSDLIIKVLWRSSRTSKSGSAKLNPDTDVTNKNKSKLPGGCVLERILKVQKLGDSDLSLLLRQYESLKALDKKPCHVSGDYASPCWQSMVQSGTSDPNDYPHVPEAPDSSCTPVTSCNDLKRYLVAKTAMDCTIMISLKPVNDDYSNRLPLGDLGIEHKDDNHVIDVCDKAFLFSAKIVDLDPKDCDKMEYYCNQEAEMLAVYAAASKSKDFIRKYCSP